MVASGRVYGKGFESEWNRWRVFRLGDVAGFDWRRASSVMRSVRVVVTRLDMISGGCVGLLLRNFLFWYSFFFFIWNLQMLC